MPSLTRAGFNVETVEVGNARLTIWDVGRGVNEALLTRWSPAAALVALHKPCGGRLDHQQQQEQQRQH